MEWVVVVCKSGYERTVLVSCLSNVLEPLVASFPLEKPRKPIEYWCRQVSVRLDFRLDRGKFCRAGDMGRIVVVCKSGYERTALISCLSNVLDRLVA